MGLKFYVDNVITFSNVITLYFFDYLFRHNIPLSAGESTKLRETFAVCQIPEKIVFSRPLILND